VTIPNGSISSVLNFTKKWSRARVEVGVDYRTDIPAALSVMDRVAKELAAEMPARIIEAPEVLEGILAFEPSAVTLRVLLKTVPGAQWEVAAAYRLRLKKAFEEAGIAISFPQMDVHLKTLPEGALKRMA
jgi:small conductance mechanosensitive channel